MESLDNAVLKGLVETIADMWEEESGAEVNVYSEKPDVVCLNIAYYPPGEEFIVGFTLDNNKLILHDNVDADEVFFYDQNSFMEQVKDVLYDRSFIEVD